MTHIFALGSCYTVGYSIAVQGAGHCRSQFGIGVAVGLAVVIRGHGHSLGGDRHIAVGDVGNDNLIIIGHIIDVEAVGIQAHIGGSDIRPGNRCGNGIFQGDGNTVRESFIYRKAFRRVGRSLVDAAASCTGDGYVDNRLRLEVGGVGIGFIDAIVILAGGIGGIGADHNFLPVDLMGPVDEVVVIIRRRGGAAGRAGSRCQGLGSGAYSTMGRIIHNVVDGHIGVFSPAAGEGYIACGHGECALFNGDILRSPAGEGVAGKVGLICHGHGGTVGVGLRGGGRGGSGGGCTGVGIGHLEVHLLPDCIERIGALVVHDDGIAGLIFRSSRGGVLAPAHEGIAGAGEVQGSVIVVLQLDGFVVQVILRRDSSGAAVGIVGQGRECGLVAPDGVEGDVGDMDGNLVAGLIDGAAVFLGTPTQEHLALGGSQVGSGHDIRVGTVGIGLGVRGRGADAAVGIISDFEGLVAGVVGIEGNIVVDQGVEVEGGVDVVGSISTPHSPASPGVALGHLLFGILGREVSLVDFGAVRNGNGLGVAAGHGQIGSAHKLRRGPLGVKHQFAAGHLSAGPVEFRSGRAVLSGVPAGEYIGIRDSGGLVGSIVLAADVRFVVDARYDFLVVAVDEGQVKPTAVIVEVYIVVAVPILRSLLFC